MTAEYLGGVLASSRTDVGRDDRAAAHTATLSRLSTYSIRTHYLIYSAGHRLWAGSDIDFRVQSAPSPVYFPTKAYAEAMAFSPEEVEDYNSILGHVLLALFAEGLIGDEWSSGGAEHLRTVSYFPRDYPEPGFIVSPSKTGIVLFGRGHGLREDVAFEAFVEESRDLTFADAPAVSAAILASSLPNPTQRE